MPKPSVYIAGQQIDLVENDLDKLLSSHTITDAENIGNRGSSVSSVIKAAGTRANRKLFGNLHLATTEANLEDGVEARIEFQGLTFLRGQYRYVKTKRKGNSVEFHFLIVGQNSWSQVLPKKAMSDLNFDLYNHFLSPEVILWSQANLDKSLFLYTHPQPAFETDVKPYEFDFALNVRRLFKEVFKNAGFKVVSDFIDSDYISRFWFHPTFNQKDSEYWNKKEAIAGNEFALSHSTPAGSGTVEITVPLTFDLDDPEITVASELVNTGLKDPENHFDTANEKYVVSEDGGYRASFNMAFSSGTILADLTIAYLYVDGFLQQQVNIAKQEITDNDNAISVQFEDLFLKAGQELTFKLTYSHNYSTTTARQYNAAAYDTTLKVEGLTHLTNYEWVNISEYYLGVENQLSFIRDCAILWDLQFITNEHTKTVFIEPEGNFYSSEQEALDSKIDGSRDIEVKEINSILAKNIWFKYKNSDTGAQIINEEGITESQEIGLSFFTKSSLVDALQHYKGALVLDGEGSNNLFYYNGSKDVEKHTIYRFNNDYTYQPGPNVIAQTNALPDIRFSDSTINLNFEDVDSDGLIKKFYSALRARIQSKQRQVSASLNWSILDISNLESTADDDTNGFRKAFHSNEHGRLRLIEIENFDATRKGSTKSVLLQDIPHESFAVTATSHTDLVELSNKLVMISSVYIERVASFPNPVDIGYSIGVEQIGLIAEYATLVWDHYESLDNVTVLTNPNGFRTLTKAVGSGDIANDQLRDNPDIVAKVIPHSVNYQGLAPLHFYSDGFTHPVWLSGYGYFSQIDAGVSFELSAFVRSISSGIYPTSNCYVTLEFLDPPYTDIGTPFSLPINTDDSHVFSLSLADPGIYTYSMYLYSDYQGAYQLVDQITAKLYVHG